ncbi:MAG: ComF family protein [Anaerovoracaceae bacterium]
MIKELWSSLLDLVYPSNIYCINCGRPIDDRFPYSLCPFCVRSIRWANKATCQSCGKPMSVQTDTGICSECTKECRKFDRGYTCVHYGMAERQLIHQLKYKDKDYLADYLAELMHERIDAEKLEPDLVVPVPMHKSKERRRGYNQAGLLAKHIAGRLGKPYFSRLLTRTSDTTPMSGLSAEQRKKNVQDVFTVAKWVQITIYDKTILLVDDVFTTGSTTEACSQALKAAGARKVYVLTFAAGMDASQKEY